MHSRRKCLVIFYIICSLNILYTEESENITIVYTTETERTPNHLKERFPKKLFDIETEKPFEYKYFIGKKAEGKHFKMYSRTYSNLK